MGTKATWAKYGSWSGPQVKGTFPYTPPANPSGFDIIVAAVARPEGGAWDTVVMYDGTAVTYGLLQWTFTSGRLHKLLAKTGEALRPVNPSKYWLLFGQDLERLTGLAVDFSDRSLMKNRARKIQDFFELRDICTPPGGRCPRTGPYWEQAKAIALLFSKLGEDSTAQRAQLEFFREELEHEKNLKRPKLHGETIADYLYPPGYTDDEEGPYLKAARALFWSAWQNAPRAAEAVLFRCKGCLFMTEAGLNKLARLIAGSTYGNWGVAKARANGRTSRYEKVAREINKVMGQKIVPELWR